jgi:predicted alpha/beta hydrolase family esterase
MKKLYIIHGWKGPPLGGWFNWVKDELEKDFFEVYILDMPEKNSPHLKTWINYLRKEIKHVDKNTYFIGHSVGCQAIMRFLCRLPKYSRIGGCVFVSGWFELKHDHYKIKQDEENKKRVKEWIEHPICFRKIRMHTKNILSIFSDNDHFVPLSNIKLFRKRFHSKIIIKNKQEHFNHTKELPEIVKYLKYISKTPKH